jgi:hypothetical protein
MHGRTPAPARAEIPALAPTLRRSVGLAALRIVLGDGEEVLELTNGQSVLGFAFRFGVFLATRSLAVIRGERLLLFYRTNFEQMMNGPAS